MKCQDTNFKNGLDLGAENDKTWMKEIKEDLNKWRNTTHSLAGKFNIVKMSFLPSKYLDSLFSLQMNIKESTK